MSSQATSIFKDPKKDRQYNGQKEKDKRTNNDPQNIIHRKLKIEKNETH